MNTETVARTPRRFEQFISLWILGVLGFFYFVGVLAQIAVGAGWLQAAPINVLFDSFKNILLPVITLVLGHYFGSRTVPSI